MLGSSWRRRSWSPSSRLSPAASAPTSSCPRGPSCTATSWRYGCPSHCLFLSVCWQLFLLRLIFCSFISRELLTWSSFPNPPPWLCSANTSWRPSFIQWVPCRSVTVSNGVIAVCSLLHSFCVSDEEQTLQTAPAHHGGSQRCWEGNCDRCGNPTGVWDIRQKEVRPETGGAVMKTHLS